MKFFPINSNKMYTQNIEIHQNDREIRAKNLGISLKKFDELLISANHAHKVFYDLGPFYGKDDIFEPTFRITAEPVYFSKELRNEFERLGNDLLYLGNALKKLPDTQKKKLGNDLDFRIPPTWRIDAILTENGTFKINEIEGVDSANALMMVEQLAYGLQTLDQSTAYQLINILRRMSINLVDGQPTKIALIRTNVLNSPHTANHKRFISFINELSKKTVDIIMLDEEELRSRIIVPNWVEFNGIINESSLSLTELQELGINIDQIISMGNYNAIGNKGVFALIFDKTLQNFWLDNLGIECFKNLQKLLIPSRFIETFSDMEHEIKLGNVIKVSWANNNTDLINRSRGVLIPGANLNQGSEERKQILKELLQKNIKIISQDYVHPSKIQAFLRKKGTSLEFVSWYNRVCVKYVMAKNPNLDLSNPKITAVGVTLGPDIIPAGRKCAFTAGAFSD